MRTSSDTLVTLYGTKVAETARAVRFVIKAYGETAISPHLSEWFPLSQVRRMVTNPNEAGRDMLVVTEWIMKEKGILDTVKKSGASDYRDPPPEIEEEEDPGMDYRDYEE